MHIPHRFLVIDVIVSYIRRQKHRFFLAFEGVIPAAVLGPQFPWSLHDKKHQWYPTMWPPPVISWFRFAPVTSSLFLYHKNHSEIGVFLTNLAIVWGPHIVWIPWFFTYGSHLKVPHVFSFLAILKIVIFLIALLNCQMIIGLHAGSTLAWDVPRYQSVCMNWDIHSKYLVGGLEHFFIFHFIYGIILPIDHWLSYFSRWLKPPTRYVWKYDRLHGHGWW